MKKIPYNSFLQSMTLFFVNDNIDEKYANLRKEKINQLKAEMSLINSRAGLQNYIRTYEDSLSNLFSYSWREQRNVQTCNLHVPHSTWNDFPNRMGCKTDSEIHAYK